MSEHYPPVASTFVIDGDSVKVDGVELPFAISDHITAERHDGIAQAEFYLVHIAVFADAFEHRNPNGHGHVQVVEGFDPYRAHALPEVYQRTDGRWAFRIKAGNGEIVATDGGQGYENKTDADRTARRLAYGWEADMKQHTDTLYGVARKETILDDELYRSYADARAKLARTEDAMRVAGLEPDIRIVQVEATTSYGRPKAATEPDVDVPPTTVPTDGAGVMPDPTTGIWGESGVPIADDPAGDSVGANTEPDADTEATTEPTPTEPVETPPTS